MALHLVPSPFCPDPLLGAAATLDRRERLEALRPHNAPRVAIVGGGIAGMSAASELVACGVPHVVVYEDRDVLESVSAVAAGLIEPVAGANDPAGVALERALFARSMQMWGALHAAQATWLISRRQVRSVSVTPREAPAWAADVLGARPMTAEELPPAYRNGSGLTFGTYVVETRAYLRMLRARLEACGVRFVRRHVESLAQIADADAIVNASGLDAGRLVDDHSLYRGDGHVVYATPMPGLRDVFMEESRSATAVADDPFAINMLYVIPRLSDVVVGGTLIVNHRLEDAPALEPGLAQHLLSLAAAVEPRLAGVLVLDYRAGSRPCRRDGVRVDLDLGGAVPVVNCYGQGGSGWTIAPALAERAVELLGPAVWTHRAV